MGLTFHRRSTGLWQARRGQADTQHYVTFNGSTTILNCGSDSSLDNLHYGTFTAELWMSADSYGEAGYSHIFSKGGLSSGWRMLTYTAASRGIHSLINYTGQQSQSYTGTDDWTPDSSWHHLALCWDEASYSTPTLWVDGANVTTYLTAAGGTIVDDASGDFIIGNISDGSRTLDGSVAWVRLSDNIRYTTAFTPAAKDSPPSVDGNTIEQWNLNDGSGGTAVAEVNSSNNGTLTNGSWTQFT